MANKLSDQTRSRLQQSKYARIVVTTPEGDVMQFNNKAEYLAGRPKTKVFRTVEVVD